MNTLRTAGEQAPRPDTTAEDADVPVDRDEGTTLDIGADLDADADETLDAAGCLVTPGLVNAHCHMAMTLLRGYADDKSPGAWLHEDIWPAGGALMPEDVHAGAELGLVETIKSETTGFADMYFHVPEIAAAVEEAGLRVCLGHGAATLGKDDADMWADIDESLDVVREFDGAADGRIRAATMPRSLTTVAEEYLHESAADAHDRGTPVHYHVNETTDEVDPIVDERGECPPLYAKDLGVFTTDDLLAHGVHVDDAETDLLVDAGTGVIHYPASNMKLASGVAPAQKLLDAGVTAGPGTGGAASSNDLDTFDEMRDAVMLGKLAVEDASVVAVSDVVRMATAGSATAVDLPGGALEVGGMADLAVVDLDVPHLTPANGLMSHLVYAVCGSDVHHTVCDGRVLMRDREVLVLDEDAVMVRAREAVALLREYV